jgi:catechol 2,3-dioxygenase-like lactoylglutathione lyase family enzyme
MQLNHLNLVVPDVAAARQLFERHFGFRHQLTRGANALAILEGRDGFVLVLAHGAPPVQYPKPFHIGFFCATREEVQAKHTELQVAGLPLEMEPRMVHGSFGFYFTALEGSLLIEVACQS